MNGLPFVLAVTLAIAAATAVEFLVAGYDEESIRFVVRLTARASLALFSAAFLASAARRVWKNAVTAWLLRNRRYTGLGFAASHTIHLAALGALAGTGVEFDSTTLVVGGVGYGFLAALAITSNDRSAKRLGRNWRRLHTAGVYYLWFVFTVTYAPAFAYDRVATVALPWLLASFAFRLWALHGRSTT